MSTATAVRASGDTATEESVVEQSKENDKPIEIEVEHGRKFRTPGFQRMRTDWNSDDHLILMRVRTVVDQRIMANFASAFQVMSDVYDLVRTPVVDAYGEIERDHYNMPVWKRTASGSYEEDWTKLTRGERENILFAITTRLFEWELAAADAWGEAMLAKGQWEEAYAIGFEKPRTGTLGDREAAGRRDAADERYFAVFVSYYSKKAEAIVRSMTLLGQRLRDSMIG